MSALVDEVDAGCRLTCVRVMVLELLASYIDHLEMVSLRQAEKLIRPRYGCASQLL